MNPRFFKRSNHIARRREPVYSESTHEDDLFVGSGEAMHEDVSTVEPNQLEHAASSYLRSARHQPVQWHPWGEAAFARAQAADKPILLDIGAVWCHWCHVMDRESY